MSYARKNLQEAIAASLGPEGEFSSANEMARRAATRGYTDNEQAFAKAINRAKKGDVNLGLDMVEAIASTLGKRVSELLDPQSAKTGTDRSQESFEDVSEVTRDLIHAALSADRSGVAPAVLEAVKALLIAVGESDVSAARATKAIIERHGARPSLLSTNDAAAKKKKQAPHEIKDRGTRT